MATFDDHGFITELEANEVIVYGSNSEGNNAGGLARYAEEKGWTEAGHAHGLSKSGIVRLWNEAAENDPDYFKKQGSLGGKNSIGYGFAHGKLDPKVTGAKGAKARWNKSTKEA